MPTSAEADPDVVIPLATLRAFLDAAERATHDAFLGLRIAVNFPRGIYGVVEFIARNCATVGDALSRISQYASLMSNRLQITYEERGGQGTVEFEIPGEPLVMGRHANEFFICALVLQGRELSSTPFVPNRVWFAHPEPDEVDELFTHLGMRNVRFGAGVNGVELAAPVLALPIRSADPALLSFLDREATQKVEQLQAPASFLDQVRSAIEARLGQGVPTLNGIARSLGLSDRTLQRRLGEVELSFRDLVDAVREQLARKHLRDPGMGLGEISFRLGYAEVSAFLRAFKRWTGMTPSQFRTQ